jgi:hypothetical protein
VGKPLGEGPFGILRTKEDNINMNLREVGLFVVVRMGCMELAQDCVQWRALVLLVLMHRVSDHNGEQ